VLDVGFGVALKISERVNVFELDHNLLA
jgi:hypothetical protein